MDLKFMTQKLVAAFFILLIYIKVSGRRQLSPLSPSDQISNMVIGGLMGSAIISPSVTIKESVTIMSIWGILQLLVRHLKYKSGGFTEFLDGKRYKLITNGLINLEELKKAKISIMDLENSLHSQGIKSISQVKNAWFDPSGNISFDLKNEHNQSNVLIFDGNFHNETLDRLKIEEDWLREKLSEVDIKDINEVICLELYKNSLYIFKDLENKRIDFPVESDI